MFRLIMIWTAGVLSGLPTAAAGDFDHFQYAELRPGWSLTPHTTERLGTDNRDASIAVYLFPSGSYAASYEERTPSCVGGSWGCSSTKVLELYREGRWTEHDGELLLSGFGVATASGRTLVLRLTDERVAPSARGRAFRLPHLGTSVVTYTLARLMEGAGYTSMLPEVRDAGRP